jgi:hypothetical protein
MIAGMTARLSRRWLSTVTVVAALATVHGLGAQAPAGGGRQRLTFLAMGSDGLPKADLKPEQVELKIDGKVRPMQSLKFVRLVATTPAAATTKIFDNPVPAPFGSNTVAPSRGILLAVDEESMRPGSDRPLKDALDQFLTGLGAQDRVGLMTLPRGSVKVDLTTTRSAVKDAIAKVTARKPSSRDATEAACHARDVVETLTSTFLGLGQGPTTVVVFSTGIAAPSTTTQSVSQNAVGGGGRISGAVTSATCELTTTNFLKLSAATGTANVTAYVVQPEVGTDSDSLSGLQDLAGAVGSPILNLANSGDSALARVLSESSAHYEAEIEVSAAERDGRGHRVDLRVTSPGVTVRAPTEILLARVDPRAPKPAAKDIVRETRAYTDLPLRVIGYTSKDQGEKIKVMAMLEPMDASVKFSSVSIGLADSKGKITTWSAAEADLAKPIIVAALVVDPGSYRLRAAAVDASGRAGAADHQIDAQIASAGPMRLGGLLLAVAGASGSMTPKMEFKDEPEVVAYFELYGNTTGGFQVGLELAETPDGPALKTETLQLGRTQEAERFTAMATLKIADLKPGDYVVRASLAFEGLPPAKIFRTLRKTK